MGATHYSLAAAVEACALLQKVPDRRCYGFALQLLQPRGRRLAEAVHGIALFRRHQRALQQNKQKRQSLVNASLSELCVAGTGTVTTAQEKIGPREYRQGTRPRGCTKNQQTLAQQLRAGAYVRTSDVSKFCLWVVCCREVSECIFSSRTDSGEGNASGDGDGEATSFDVCRSRALGDLGSRSDGVTMGSCDGNGGDTNMW